MADALIPVFSPSHSPSDVGRDADVNMSRGIASHSLLFGCRLRVAGIHEGPPCTQAKHPVSHTQRVSLARSSGATRADHGRGSISFLNLSRLVRPGAVLETRVLLHAHLLLQAHRVLGHGVSSAQEADWALQVVSS